MEVVGTVATLVQLTDAGLRIAKTSKNLCKAYRGTNDALIDADKQASSIQQTIDEILSLRPQLDHPQPGLVSLHTRACLASAVEQLAEALEQLKKSICLYKDRETTAVDKMRWALRDRSDADSAQKKLETAKITLLTALQLLGIRLSTIHHSSMETVLAGQRALEQQMAQVLDVVTFWNQTIHSGTDARMEEVNSDDSAGDELPQEIVASRSSPLELRWPLGSSILDMKRAPDSPYKRKVLKFSKLERDMSGAASMAWNDNNAVYSLSMKARLPWWLGQRALVLELRIQQHSLAWSSLSILPSLIGLSNYLARDSMMFRAVKTGDVRTVRSLLADCKASPNDRFPRNENTMGGFWEEEEPTVLAVCDARLPRIR